MSSPPRPQLRLMAWVVCATLLLAALLPTLSHAVLPAHPVGWAAGAEICSATGVHVAPATVPAPGQLAPVSGEPGGSGTTVPMDCAYCALHLGALGLPPSALAWAVPHTLGFQPPHRFLSAPRTVLAWAPAQARAPPSLG